MSFRRNLITEEGMTRSAHVGDRSMPAIIINSTASHQTITAAMVANGLGIFTGAAGAVNYTIDSVANLAPVLKGMSIGESYEFRVTNVAAQAATLLGATDITLVSSLSSANAATRTGILVKTGGTAAAGTDATYDLYYI